MIKLDSEFSQEMADKNKVEIKDLLDAIHVFHEVLQEEYSHVIQCHPYINLHSDGSGEVIAYRGTYVDYNNKTNEKDQRKYIIITENNEKFIVPHKRTEGTILFTFHSLVELVNEAKRLIKKYDIQWTI